MLRAERQALLEGCQQVCEGGLFLGGRKAASNSELLASLNIRAVLSVTDVPAALLRFSLPESAAPPSSRPPCESGQAGVGGGGRIMLKHLVVRIKDSPDANLLQELSGMLAFIDAGMQEGGVLVHCEEGVSRSAAVCIAYLMRSFRMSLDDALRRVRAARRIVCPNAGFLRQLMAFERAGCDAEADFAEIEAEEGAQPSAQVKMMLAAARGSRTGP